MSEGYDNGIRLERKFAKEIKCILGLVFIGQDAEMDRNQATDFLTFTIKNIKVACRLRTYNYYLKYPDEFTIRSELYSGNKTELQKIREELVDYIFYGFVDENENKIIRYFIGDLDIFRKYEQTIKYEKQINKDARPNKFRAYKINHFPRIFIIKEYTKE